MDTLLEALIESPLLPRQLERLNQILAEERPRRERFYEEMTEDDKWEFINGEIIMHSPAKRRHLDASKNLVVLLDAHLKRHDLGWVATEKLLVCLTRNDYEPDVCYFRKEVAERFPSDQMKYPAPDFIAEVLSPSTTHNDRGIKRRDYAAHGVAEYWIIDPVARTIEQHGLHGDEYRLAGHWKETDSISSLAVLGFQIPVIALFDSQANFAALTHLIEQNAAR